MVDSYLQEPEGGNAGRGSLKGEGGKGDQTGHGSAFSKPEKGS